VGLKDLSLKDCLKLEHPGAFFVGFEDYSSDPQGAWAIRTSNHNGEQPCRLMPSYLAHGSRIDLCYCP